MEWEILEEGDTSLNGDYRHKDLENGEACGRGFRIGILKEEVSCGGEGQVSLKDRYYEPIPNWSGRLTVFQKKRGEVRTRAIFSEGPVSAKLPIGKEKSGVGRSG